jgi:hypothetical protein
MGAPRKSAIVNLGEGEKLPASEKIVESDDVEENGEA